MARILLIDDDVDVLKMLKISLESNGHKVTTLSEGSRVIEEIQHSQPEIVITDILMPGITGGIIYQQIRKLIGSHLPIIICTGTKIRLDEQNDPLLVHLTKPFNCVKLEENIQRLLTLSKTISFRGVAEQEKN
ncbi:MAG: response regulator [Candidatus Sumerlaeia bacterium]|nr:response regulator [Candidatus Sumerlaeia bacterium]